MTSRYQLYALTTELHNTLGELGHVIRYYYDMSRIYYENQATKESSKITKLASGNQTLSG